MLESEGAAYLDEREDYRGYSSKSGMGAIRQRDDEDAIDKVGRFFKRQSTQIKRKYEETDFKGGA